MAKVQYTKLHLTAEKVTMYTDLLQKIKMPFKIEVSNYTSRITSKGYNLYFIKNELSNSCFAAAEKIKKDVALKDIPVVDRDKDCYFDTCFKGDAFYADRVYNIDIKSAYPTIMKNAGYITEETYEYLSKLEKLERLAALGMLATRKEIFEYDAKGKCIESEYINPLSNFFFYCVQETERAIQHVRNQVLEDSFLFSWVDGIYYLNDNANYHKISAKVLKDQFNLDCTFQMLTDFEVLLQDDFYEIEFIDGKKQPKTFSIPLPETQLKKQIIKHLLTKKYDK